MAKYNTYIELSPHYESVVDLHTEKRNPNLWQEYIVHEDMRVAVEKICESLRNEYKDARRSFWIHGAYGTGKSYAAIVLKHLFEDTIPNIQNFMSKQLLLPYRNKFTAIREKGDFLVVWKSGCTGIRSGTHLMMEMEMSIRNRLAEKFADKAYYGRKSLIAAVQELLNDTSINWQNIFTDPAYGLSEEYASFDEFYDEVMTSKLDTCNTVARICRDKGWALFATVDMFEAWIKDIIEGNGLSETGIIFIWDEFTTFVRECGDDNVLQRLSEYCKQQPFFMFLIVHIEPSWLVSLGEETYKRILHRYHELEFHISESAAYELIGDSILTRSNMSEQWKSVKDQLMKSISKNMADFDVLDLGNQRERLRQLCPLHPMTLSFLTTVAHNFGAEQRTLFRFMKDRYEAEQQVGFIHYIDTYGPDDWRWLTPDFLWDYFFTRESDIKGELSAEARRCYQHYIIKKDIVTTDMTALHVFKAVMLLIAVMTTEKISQLRSQMTSRKMAATKRNLYKCFAGQLTESDVDKYLEAFEANGMIQMDRQPNGDARLELPYQGNVDVFDVRLDQIKRKYTRYELFKKGSAFSKALEEKIWDKNKATSNRLQIVACSSETNSLNTRLAELRAEIAKNPYKIGLFVVTIAEASQYATMQTKLKEIAKADATGRLIICIAREPLTDERLDRWHRAITHKELAGEEGKKGSADQYENEAAIIIEEWAQPTVDGQLAAFYRDIQYSAIYGRDELIRRMETEVIFKVFSAAPELVVTQSTAFKKSQENAAVAAITRVSANAQVNNIANGIKAAHAWEIGSLAELEQCTDTAGARAVSALAKYIREQLSQGAKVKLDSLWMELQNPPFGYYDSLACAYLLGYVLRFYKNGEFNWVDSSNNTFPLTEKNLATMVYKICRGDVVNNTLSSGSDIWQQFRPYAQKIFKLSAEESVSEEQARKYMRERINSSGTPFWAIKYIPEEKLGGNEAKNVVCHVADALCAFIAEQDNQEDAMSKVITLFKGRGQVRQAMEEAFASDALRYMAFRLFILENQPQLKDLVDTIGINPNELFDAIKSMMQGYIYTWTEEQVVEKLQELTLEYQLINTLNGAMGVKRKTMKQLRQELRNCFENMKVPGYVIETFEKPWVPALKLLHRLSLDGWGSLTTTQKQQNIEVLRDYAKTAWEYVGTSKLLLSEYLSQQNMICTDAEIDNMFAGLKSLPYNTPEVSFRASIQTFIENISYERNKQQLLALWKERSGEDTVGDWCRRHATPIQWVLDDVSLQHVLLVKSLNEGKKVDNTQLRNAVDFFEKSSFDSLRDTGLIKSRFLLQIGESNAAAFLESCDDILARIRIKLGADVFAWGHKAGEVRSIIEVYTREKNAAKYRETAKTSVMKMPETDLRNRVIALLEQYPEFCKLFLEPEG
jgi:hypothetical protein